jgi:hypothetical protein
MLLIFIILRLLSSGRGKIAEFSKANAFYFLNIAGSIFAFIIFVSILYFIYNGIGVIVSHKDAEEE